MTLLFARTVDADGVRDALVARRTAAWLRDDVWGAEEHLKGIWSGAIVNETQEKPDFKNGATKPTKKPEKKEYCSEIRSLPTTPLSRVSRFHDPDDSNRRPRAVDR
jgi:hypothetical protein